MKYIILWFSFQLLVEINCQMAPFKPKQRIHHTATVIDDKLYILDGAGTIDIDTVNEFFYLDVSVPFNTQKLLWQDLSSVNTVPAHIGAASVIGGVNNSTLFLYGGTTIKNDATTKLVYTFDSQSNTWTVPTIAGVNIIRKVLTTGIIDFNGKMYLWGGLVKDTTGVYNNDMLILDTKKLIWELGSSFDAPTGRCDYGATLLPDSRIIYMGKQVILVACNKIIFLAFLLLELVKVIVVLKKITYICII